MIPSPKIGIEISGRLQLVGGYEKKHTASFSKNGFPMLHSVSGPL